MGIQDFYLIYGLPRQSKKTVIDIWQKDTQLAPDLSAYYSYAHLPESLQNQKLKRSFMGYTDKKALCLLG